MSDFDRIYGPRILVITHAQRDFKAACDPFTLGNICREAELCKQLGLPAMALEFPEPHLLQGMRAEAKRRGAPFPVPRENVLHPKTQPCIVRLFDGYGKFVVRHTYDSNCGINIVYGCADNRFVDRPGHYRVVGVNTDACVLKTVIGLLEFRPDARIEVVQDACNTSNVDDPDGCWDRFPEEVVLLPGGGQAPQLVAPILPYQRAA